jgi:formamidopyrimidine-DNA glycosylase
MPELPDVEIFKRYLDATALHQKIEGVRIDDARVLKGVSKRSLRRRLVKHALEKTRRHGKHLFARVGDAGWLRLHFGMTGFLRYFKKQDKAPGHVRLQIDFANGYRLAYDNQRLLGQVGWVQNPDQYAAEEKLGPDALNGLTPGGFKQILSDRKGFVKSALMNQSVIAGLGNVYTDEILFRARLHPRARLADLSEKEIEKLFDAMQAVLAKAIAAKADPEKMPPGFLLPHRDRQGRCPRCGHDLEKLTVAGRSGYACPNCQGSS